MTKPPAETPLLAKSYDRSKYADAPPRYALLTTHTLDVVEACDALAAVSGRVALGNAGIDLESFARFRKTLRANAWIQDLGKANSHFQEMLTNKPTIRQLIRHEVLSGLLIWSETRLRDWYSRLDIDLRIAVWGAMGHHRKFDQRTTTEHVSRLQVFLTHPDTRAILAWMGHDLKLAHPPIFDDDLFVAESRKEDCDLAARGLLDALIVEFEDLESEFSDPLKLRFLALVKSFGIAADVAASAYGPISESSSRRSVAAYIRQNLGGVGLSDIDFSRLINHWAWDHTESNGSRRDDNITPPGFSPRRFQEEVAASPSYLTLAKAGCGSGKSLAAYMWGRDWCARRERDGVYNFRFFFCLPTTGTTTEHFKDYALESGIDASLSHSRASVDLSTIADAAGEETAGEHSDAADAARFALRAERDKIESLKLWSVPIVVGTADTVLGLMANSRRSILTLPAIMNSGIVLDEIHAFDEQMFGHLLVFLKNFPCIPVLLMTASLPDQRLDALKAIRPDLFVVPGPADYELLERYKIAEDRGENSQWDAVDDCIAKGGKVLWVRNRVEWANQTYRECSSRFATCKINVYHSRLRYKDRSVRHRRVIDQFKKRNEAAILVATQVAEMSLDLSADLLISDIAPTPALIQRMGRLNRRSTPDKPEEPKVALIRPLPSDSRNPHSPYDKLELEQAKSWVDALLALQRPISQRDLAVSFGNLCKGGAFDIGAADERAWFFGKPGKTGVWRTRPGFTREAGYTISVILETDLRACESRNRRGEPTSEWLRKFEVSIPIKPPVLSWKQIAGVRIAPDDMVEYDYDESTQEGTGAKWS